VIPLLLALALAAPTAPSPELRRARDRFEFGAWSDCAAIVRQVVAGRPDLPEEEAVQAWQMLGISEWHLGDRAQARAAFVSLLQVDPDHQLDAFLVPPAIVEFFEEVKRAEEPTLGTLRKRRRLLRDQERLAEEARRRLFAEERARTGPATKVIRVQERSYILNWMPLGAGQFQNGHRAKGTAIAAGELLLGAINIGSILIHNQIVDDSANRCSPSARSGCTRPPYTDAARRNLNVVDAIKYSSAGLFWGLYGLGVWDAHRYYVPRVETEVSPKDAGLTVSLRWDF
jgi:hypothetical protein